MPKRCYTHMSFEERETLNLGLTLGHSLRTMATVLGRAPSTVSREHARKALGTPYRALHGAEARSGPGSPAAPTAQTAGSRAVAVCADTSD